MPDIELPLSRDVSQVINPWTALFKAVGNQFNLFTINVGRSADPTAEREVRGGGQLRQAARLIQDARRAGRASEEWACPTSSGALADFRQMFNNIADVRSRHANQPVLRFKDNPASELTAT